MEERKELVFEVQGMTCDHCAISIDQALRRLPGVLESSTTFSDGLTTVVVNEGVDQVQLRRVVEDKGYRILPHDVPAAPSRPTAKDAYDLAIIGAGSAAFAAAIRAAELGARAVIVASGALGGTCVNVGCVPSKTLLRAAEIVHKSRLHGFAGIRAQVEPPDLRALLKQKDELVAELQQTKYRDVLAAYPTLTLIEGHASFEPGGDLVVAGRTVKAGRVVIASGARPWIPPIPGLGEARYLTSTEAMSVARLPRSLIVLGGSSVGLELGQFFARMGSKVTILEVLPRLLASEDPEIGEALANYLRQEGLEIRVGVSVRKVSYGGSLYRVEIAEGEMSEHLSAEQILVATGRRPNTGGMGLEEAGIRLGSKGVVLVDKYLETSHPGIYAAGDVIGDPALVYVAAYAGNLAAENALQGNVRTYDVSVVPKVTFCDPGVSSVGLTESQAAALGFPVAVSKLPLSSVPRAIAARDTRGFIKLVANSKTNTLVGAHILAPDAGEMIQAASMAIRFGIRIDQIASMLHPYLTNSEAIKLACQTFNKDVAKLSCCAA